MSTPYERRRAEESAAAEAEAREVMRRLLDVGAYSAVAAERYRQDLLWGVQDHPDGTSERLKPLVDLVRTTTQRAADCGQVSWRQILFEEVMEACAEEQPDRLRTELVQAAAVITAWVEALDRRTA